MCICVYIYLIVDPSRRARALASLGIPRVSRPLVIVVAPSRLSLRGRRLPVPVEADRGSTPDKMLVVPQYFTPAHAPPSRGASGTRPDEILSIGSLLLLLLAVIAPADASAAGVSERQTREPRRRCPGAPSGREKRPQYRTVMLGVNAPADSERRLCLWPVSHVPLALGRVGALRCKCRLNEGPTNGNSFTTNNYKRLSIEIDH